MTDNIKLPPLPPLHIVPSVEPVDYPEVAQALMDYARAAVLADRQQRGGDVTDDMRSAVRFAPSSAYWSERLREFFGPDAREGIEALEKQLREARAALSAAQDAPAQAAQAVPQGWVMVPKEPTPEMVLAGAKEADWYDHNASDCYRAMLAAAPASPQPAALAAMPDEIEGLRAHVALLKAALAQAERLGVENHRLRRAMQKIMARLTDLLDEDQFGNIESIVTEVGVEPPEPDAQEADDARDAERYRLLRKGAVDDVAVVRDLGAMDYGMSTVVYTYLEEIEGYDLDAAIDAAMKENE